MDLFDVEIYMAAVIRIGNLSTLLKSRLEIRAHCIRELECYNVESEKHLIAQCMFMILDRWEGPPEQKLLPMT